MSFDFQYKHHKYFVQCEFFKNYISAILPCPEMYEDVKKGLS